MFDKKKMGEAHFTLYEQVLDCVLLPFGGSLYSVFYDVILKSMGINIVK